MNKTFPVAGDLWGGLAAASLLLPQAMAFGMTLWLAAGLSASEAALSGLITATALSLSSGLLGGTRGLISAPTGPTLILLSGAVVTLHTQGVNDSHLIAALSCCIVLAGIIQMAMGWFHLGHLVKFIPYPVVMGFITGSAVLMVLSQQAVVITPLTTAGGWIPLFAALATLVIMVAMERQPWRIPASVIALLVGTLLFHALTWLCLDGATPTSWVVGELPALSDIHRLDISHALNWPWWLMLAIAASLAVLASLDTLLTSVIADVSSGCHHDDRRELIGQGGGHVLAALFGGMAGAGTTGATLLALRSGGQRWTAVINALIILSIIVVFSDAAALLPISVFAGIIFHVAIFGMLDKDPWLWFKQASSRLDGWIMLTVTIITVSYDLMVAVIFGVVLAVIQFLRQQANMGVIRQRWRGHQRKSSRQWSQQQAELLTQGNHAILGYTLRGALFFGTTDHVYSSIQQEISDTRYIILDLRRVEQIDLTALYILKQLAALLRERGGELILAHVPPGIGLIKAKGHAHTRLISFHHDVFFRTFSDVDEALEYAEISVLEWLGGNGAANDQVFGLAQVPLLHELNPRLFHHLKKILVCRNIASSQVILAQGAYNESLFIMLEGEVEIRLHYGTSQHIRISRLGAGVIFGDVTFLQAGACTAEVRALHDVVCLELKRPNFNILTQQHPRLAADFLLRLGAELGQDLRRSNRMLRHILQDDEN
ncbi:MAG: SulP family inorganic anion transporter [Mariprofundaceae bacterium]|nr:SulP family inorganic anion transporter [Mariprofundaceae bacterium]